MVRGRARPEETAVVTAVVAVRAVEAPPSPSGPGAARWYRWERSAGFRPGHSRRPAR
ncbi:acyl-CoA carboxylase epsilon subunit [Streptomyces sviceus]|uniref:acyl-CoA carboxylase epsilon subunit n=1 Tax=Streptomyces sviceus TaxID=285530 RepID=UPI003826ABAC